MRLFLKLTESGKDTPTTDLKGILFQGVNESEPKPLSNLPLEPWSLRRLDLAGIARRIWAVTDNVSRPWSWLIYPFVGLLVLIGCAFYALAYAAMLMFSDIWPPARKRRAER